MLTRSLEILAPAGFRPNRTVRHVVSQSAGICLDASAKNRVFTHVCAILNSGSGAAVGASGNNLVQGMSGTVYSIDGGIYLWMSSNSVSFTIETYSNLATHASVLREALVNSTFPWPKIDIDALSDADEPEDESLVLTRALQPVVAEGVELVLVSGNFRNSSSDGERYLQMKVNRYLQDDILPKFIGKVTVHSLPTILPTLCDSSVSSVDVVPLPATVTPVPSPVVVRNRSRRIHESQYVFPEDSMSSSSDIMLAQRSPESRKRPRE